MKKFTLTTSKFGFIIIAFLVLALTCITLFINRYTKNSNQLDSTVKDLTNTHSEEEKIDSALALLYIAENNARMYALSNNHSYYNAYRVQINSVKELLTDLNYTGENEKQLNKLVVDKQQKTQLFLKAQSVIDSIIITANKARLSFPVKKLVYRKPLKIDTASYETIDTSLISNKPLTKKSKGLFGRLSDAILNKKDTASIAVDKILINRFTKDSVKMQYENTVLHMQISDLQNHQKELDNLKKKEKAVLDANHTLFANMQSLLQQIKEEELSQQQQRTQQLGKHAFSLTKNIKINSYYITFFSAFLSLIILIILFVLYKNEMALKRAKQQAEDYAKLKSEFTATMSHEIRTPLHSIHAFADQLNPLDGRTHQSEIIDAIKLSSGMLLSVVNNILDFTKIEKGKFKLEYLPFNPVKIINEILAGLKIQAKQKNLSLTGELDASINRDVYGDAFQLRQILLNIISNAIKYTEHGSVIVVANAIYKMTNKIILHVQITDTGIGIAEKDVPHLFEEFSTNHHHSEIVAGSSGLGLNIVKKLVELHKGSIDVKSALNQGTTFTIELPYDVKDVEQNHEFSKSIEHSAKTKLQILLVENDTFNQRFLIQLLSKHHASVQVANDAEAALLLLQQYHFDLILTDIGLPGMKGTTLANNIKNSESENANSIIFGLTGFEKNEVNTNKNDFNEWLVKPFKSSDLLAKIKQYFPDRFSF